ncbi:hypothetical protein FTV88_2449 [Heliorestis convoluta]|uniref:Uncharacterized protein n=1 Tax=Heliorestis convoluta TaxID=356322 RepID=A0A5Q2N7T0_9FIRM|nr:hypothetical protein FTV88_2449 [Heliorestis convoluta]
MAFLGSTVYRLFYLINWCIFFGTSDYIVATNRSTPSFS